MSSDYNDHASAKRRYMHVAFAAYLGSLSIGLAVGFSSPAMEELAGEFDKLDKSLFGSILTIGALIGGLLAGVAGEKIGRRGTILATTGLFSVGWLLVLTRQNAAMLYSARFILGTACGINCMIVPVYLGEVSTPEHRGMLGTGHQFSTVFGVFIAYCLGSVINVTLLAIASLVPVAATTIMFFMPESPTWLVKKGRPDTELMFSLYSLFGRTRYAEAQRDILMDLKEDDGSYFTISDMVRPPILKPLGLALSLMFLQQMSGINAVIFYMKDIFASAKTSIDENVEAIIIGGIQVIFTIPTAIMIDRAGRRVLLHIAGIIEAVGLALLISFYLIKHSYPETASHMAFLPVSALSLYVTGFAIGYGPIPWLMMGELIPDRARGVGTGLLTAFNWFCAFLVTNLFPKIMDHFGEEVAYGIFLGIVSIGVIYVFVFIPETKGKTFEEIEIMFQSPQLDISIESGGQRNGLQVV
ncbi:facilitated trehalose transporter Tret1-2 homolog [Varroa jacobsoni]|uniref:Major facilitator superfamily (MFS) profile domain-containing protein n=1 Tax=Varroa destructor TaxID=109461 RepID=A0A7M7JYF2_VARDE|nr:facilitated trehalose transporter Tret1-2 homolog [Varroa destructor]XP_022685918.1 facilitated trehalose transporter Tret1-2 homolog [Varroa jacobsoni]